MCAVQPASPLQRVQELGQGWMLGAALLQRSHLLTIQQLLIKGLFNQDTQLVTVQVIALTLANMSHNPCAGVKHVEFACISRRP